MGKSYLVEGARLRCLCGSKCSRLKVTDHGYYADGKKKANCKDCLPDVNIPDFGMCKRNKDGKVCKGFMKLADKWESLSDSDSPETLSGHAALTMDSVLLCKKGGLIVPESSGQGSVREIVWETFQARYAVKQALAALGIKDGCLYGHDPVNLNTGNFLYEKEDLVVQGRTRLSFHVYYNSMDKYGGCLGKGWRHNYEIQVVQERDGTIFLHYGDGRRAVFRRSIGDVYTPVCGDRGMLRKNADGYRYVSGDVEYVFGKDGAVYKAIDRDGNTDMFTYNAQGQLEEVRGANGGILHYYYNIEGKLYRVCDHTGREVRLGYSYGVLRKFKNSMGHVYRYGYNENGRLESVTTPRGIEGVRNTYDAANRVVKQETPDGGVVEFRYDDAGMCAYERNRDGHIVSHESDGWFRNTRNVYGNGEERYTYDSGGRIVFYVDRNGNGTRFGYDGKGNLSKITDALGRVMGISRDGEGRITSVTVCGKVLGKNVYDAEGRPVETSDALGRSRKTVYGGNGLPERITMPDGSSILIRYDGRGNILGVTDPYGNTTSYAYDALNRVTESTDTEGGTIRYQYNERNRLTRVVNQEGNVRTYAYDESGRPVSVEDFDGGTLSVAYNEMGRPEKLTDKEGRETFRFYGRNGKISREISSSGAVSDFSYDGNGRLVRVELGSEQGENGTVTVISYGYDPVGNLTSVGMGDGKEELSRVSYGYDALNRMVEAVDPVGGKTVYSYDEMGNVGSITDPAGNRRTFRYNAAGELIGETDIRGNTVRYEYDVMGRLTAVTDGAGRTTRHFYRKGGRLEKTVYPDSSQVSYGYDRMGRVSSATDGQGYRLDYGYDCMGRLVSVTGSDGWKKTYTHDAMGNVTSMTDAGGNVTLYEYTLGGQRKAVTDALGNRTEYVYDGGDRLVYVCRKGQEGEKDRETFYGRNSLGQVECIRDAFGREEHYAYDALGRMVLKTDRDGYQTVYGYEPDGKVRNILYGDGMEVQMEYTALRRLALVRDWLGETRLERDAAGQPVSITDHAGRTVTYEWGGMGERKSITYPDGTKVSYRYDTMLRLDRMRVESVGRTGMPSEIRYLYDAAGRLAGKEYPDGMYTQWHYDGYGRLGELVHGDRDGILEHFRYEYDIAGNKNAIMKDRRGLAADSGRYGYCYDPLGRLSGVSKDGHAVRTYTYDSFGNRKGMEDVAGGKTLSYFHDVLDRLVRVEEWVDGTDGLPSVTEYFYDGRGNMVREETGGELLHGYEYGAMGRLSRAWDADGQEALYLYNGMGQRTGKREGDSGEEYLLDLTKPYNNLLGVRKNGHSQDFFADWNITAMKETEGRTDGGRAAFGGLHWYLRDELDSPLRVSGYRAGNGIPGCRCLTYGYDEFGKDAGAMPGNVKGQPNRYDIPGLEQPFGYTGYRHDGISGTYFAQAREYRPGDGRFASEDVAEGNRAVPVTLNRYGYCHGNPVAFVDRDGKTAIPWTTTIPSPITTFGNIEEKTKKMEQVLETVNDAMQELEEKSKDNTGTVTLGYNLSLTPGFWQLDGLVGVSFDFRGNIAVQVTGSGGVTVGTPSVAGVGFISVTNAPKVGNLKDDGLSIGGSGMIPMPSPVAPSVGAEYNLVGDINNQNSDWYHGITINGGVAFGAGGEGHIEWGSTKMFELLNIFKVWNWFYGKVKGNSGEEDGNKK